MRYGRNRAIAILMLSLILLLATSFYITPTSISDTDSSTYVVVPILMLPLFILFTFKSDLEPKVKKKDVAIGVAAFILFLLLTVALRIYFSFYFVSFRIDLMLMPLAIAALASILFGAWSIGKFKAAMFYSLLSSPAILYPLARTSGAFAQANSIIVYDAIKLFISSVQYVAPITISANGYSIGIGQACVSMGIFIALALFLIPIAYFYNGDLKRKVCWVASGVALLLILNVVRMFSISMVWLTYGPSQTALLVHTFFGVIMFYAVIALMILTSKFYDLEISKEKKGRVAARRHTEIKAGYVIVALTFSLAYLFLTLNYSSSLKVSPISLSQHATFNFSNVQVSSALSDLVNRNNFSSIVLSDVQGSYAAFSMWNKTINSSDPILLVATIPSQETTEGMIRNNTLLGNLNFFNSNGTAEHVYDMISEGTEYAVYNTNMPILLENQTSVITSIYVIIPLSDLPNVTSCSTHDPIYSGIVNLINPTNYNQTTSRKINSAECVSNKIVWA